MGVRSFRIGAEKLRGQDVGGSDAPPDDRGAGAERAGIRPLRAPQTEFHDGVPLGRVCDARRLGRDEALMIDQAEQRRLQQLRLDDRRGDADKRFPRKDDAPFRNGVNVSVKAKVREILQKILPEQVKPAQIFDILLGKAEIFHIFNGLLQPRRDGEGGVKRIFTVEQVEDRDLVFFVVYIIPLHHGQLIQIGHERQIFHGNASFPY